MFPHHHMTKEEVSEKLKRDFPDMPATEIDEAMRGVPAGGIVSIVFMSILTALIQKWIANHFKKVSP